MNKILYHLSGVMLRAGSIIEPGNFGRIIREVGVQHDQWAREHSLEAARLKQFAKKPSRFDAAFGFVDENEAKAFRAGIPGFGYHILYEVSLVEPKAASHSTDQRLVHRQGPQNYDWASLYWQEYDPQKTSIPGIGLLATARGGVAAREFVTLSPLQIEKTIL